MNIYHLPGVLGHEYLPLTKGSWARIITTYQGFLDTNNYHLPGVPNYLYSAKYLAEISDGCNSMIQRTARQKIYGRKIFVTFLKDLVSRKYYSFF